MTPSFSPGPVTLERLAQALPQCKRVQVQTEIAYTLHQGKKTVLDISAIQEKYGANHQTRKEDNTYGFNSNTQRGYYTLNTAQDRFIACIWDGAGNDTLDVSGYQSNQNINRGRVRSRTSAATPPRKKPSPRTAREGFYLQHHRFSQCRTSDYADRTRSPYADPATTNAHW